MFAWERNPLLIVMLIMAAPQVMAAFRYDSKAPRNAVYYATSLKIKLLYGGLYLGLVTFLALGSYEIHLMLQAR